MLIVLSGRRCVRTLHGARERMAQGSFSAATRTFLFIGNDRGLTVFNPGSIGPRRFRLPILFGVLEIAAGKLSMRHVDCETGGDGTP